MPRKATLTKTAPPAKSRPCGYVLLAAVRLAPDARERIDFEPAGDLLLSVETSGAGSYELALDHAQKSSPCSTKLAGSLKNTRSVWLPAEDWEAVKKKLKRESAQGIVFGFVPLSALKQMVAQDVTHAVRKWQSPAAADWQRSCLEDARELLKAWAGNEDQPATAGKGSVALTSGGQAWQDRLVTAFQQQLDLKQHRPPDKHEEPQPHERPGVDLSQASLPTAALRTWQMLANSTPNGDLADVRQRTTQALAALSEIESFKLAAINRILEDLADHKIATFAEKTRWADDLNRLCAGMELVVVKGTRRVRGGAVVSIALEHPSPQYREGRFIVGQTTGDQPSIRRVALPALRARYPAQA